MSTSGTIELVYDGDCGLCRASISWLRRRDVDERINAYTSESCTWDDVDSSLFLTTVVARSDEGVVTASTAAATALSVLPGGWGLLGRLVLRANRAALMQRLSDGCYYLVARHRIAISKLLVRCRLIDASCALPAR
ncbi:MAG: DCC1-like thiol-disulfide oxidoreductase family protein [Actinomycetes bacterium]